MPRPKIWNDLDKRILPNTTYLIIHTSEWWKMWQATSSAMKRQYIVRGMDTVDLRKVARATNSTDKKVWLNEPDPKAVWVKIQNYKGITLLLMDDVLKYLNYDLTLKTEDEISKIYLEK